MMNDSNAFICSECNCWMDYHELVKGGEEEVAGDRAAVLCDFYSCPRCGATSVPGEQVLPRAANARSEFKLQHAPTAHPERALKPVYVQKAAN